MSKTQYKVIFSGTGQTYTSYLTRGAKGSYSVTTIWNKTKVILSGMDGGEFLHERSSYEDPAVELQELVELIEKLLCDSNGVLISSSNAPYDSTHWIKFDFGTDYLNIHFSAKSTEDLIE